MTTYKIKKNKLCFQDEYASTEEIREAISLNVDMQAYMTARKKKVTHAACLNDFRNGHSLWDSKISKSVHGPQ